MDLYHRSLISRRFSWSDGRVVAESTEGAQAVGSTTEQAGVLTGRTLVTGVVGDDIHVLGIRLVEHALRAAGANVVSLGVMTPVPEFVEAAVETAADGVVISSSNGHAALFCDGIREIFIEAGIGDMPLFIGGNLAVGKQASWAEVEQDYLDLGFDLVFPPNAGLDEAMQQLARCLAERGR
jgi:methylaspartate mutase sigma subunit